MKLQVTKSSPVWQGIIADNENWFSRLKETEQGIMFISSEWNYNQTIKLFSVRVVTDTGIDTVGEFGQYETLAEALRAY